MSEKYEAGHLTSWADRRILLIEFQEALVENFGEDDYNVFVFGSFIRTDFKDGFSDIDMIVYCQDQGKQTDVCLFCNRFFKDKGLPADVIQYYYIERAFIYPYAILGAVRMTDYYPKQLRADLFNLMREYPQYKEEQRQRRQYLRWSWIVNEKKYKEMRA